MSRKDYERLAAALRREVESWPDSGGEAVDLVRQVLRNTVESVAEALADDNPRFDKARFLSASGL